MKKEGKKREKEEEKQKLGNQEKETAEKVMKRERKTGKRGGRTKSGKIEGKGEKS